MRKDAALFTRAAKTTGWSIQILAAVPIRIDAAERSQARIRVL